MRAWIVPNFAGKAIDKGPMIGFVPPYWTRECVTVFMVGEDQPFNDAIPAIPGMVGMVIPDPGDHQILHIIGSDGLPHALPLKVSMIVNEIDIDQA